MTADSYYRGHGAKATAAANFLLCEEQIVQELMERVMLITPQPWNVIP
jgi:hypothetical protein